MCFSMAEARRVATYVWVCKTPEGASHCVSAPKIGGEVETCAHESANGPVGVVLGVVLPGEFNQGRWCGLDLFEKSFALEDGIERREADENRDGPAVGQLGLMDPRHERTEQRPLPRHTSRFGETPEHVVEIWQRTQPVAPALMGGEVVQNDHLCELAHERDEPLRGHAGRVVQHDRVNSELVTEQDHKGLYHHAPDGVTHQDDMGDVLTSETFPQVDRLLDERQGDVIVLGQLELLRLDVEPASTPRGREGHQCCGVVREGLSGGNEILVWSLAATEPAFDDDGKTLGHIGTQGNHLQNDYPSGSLVLYINIFTLFGQYTHLLW